MVSAPLLAFTGMFMRCCCYSTLGHLQRAEQLFVRVVPSLTGRRTPSQPHTGWLSAHRKDLKPLGPDEEARGYEEEKIG